MNKILSVTLAISLMAILLVGCNAENGKIGNGINGTVTDNQSAVSSTPGVSSATSNNDNDNNVLEDIGDGISDE